MKRLLTVTAIFLFAICSQAFTSFTSPTANSTAQTVHPGKTSLLCTAWVDPWAGVKSLQSVTSKLNTAEISYTFDKWWPYNEYYKIYVNNVLTIDLTSSANGNFTIPAGATVRLEAGFINPSDPWAAFIAYVDDYYMGGSTELFFQDTPGNLDFSFTAEEGHMYYLFVRD